MCHGFVFLKWFFPWLDGPLLCCMCRFLFSFYLDFSDHMNYCVDFFFFILVNCDKLPRTNWTANNNAAVCQNMFGSWAEKIRHSKGFIKGEWVVVVCFNNYKLKASSPRNLCWNDYQSIRTFLIGRMKCWLIKQAPPFTATQFPVIETTNRLKLEGKTTLNL